MRAGEVMAEKMQRDIVAQYDLESPVQFGASEVIERLEFTEPTLEVLEAMERASGTSGMQGAIKLISMVADIDLPRARAIKARDLKGIMETLRPFLPEAETPDLSAITGGGE